jgi:type III restriction enzyme
VRYTLKDYQALAAAEIVKTLRRRSRDYEEDQTLSSVALSAPTGAGKTVIAAAVIETLFDGDETFAADPLATVLWVTDDPALNVQTARNMTQASSTLGPSRLLTIDSSFDQENFAAGKVYFLNIQKLARTNPLARSNVDGREFSLWQTIGNTIKVNGSHFYVVIDEAHKGMRADSDRPTIVSRIINGQSASNAPAPIVWGISATLERFNQAIARWSDERTNKIVNVPIDDVRASGLLKDKIVLDSPEAGQADGDTTLVRAAVKQTMTFEAAWHTYATSQNEPPVVPALVVQVPPNPSAAELGEVLDAIFSAWDGLQDADVVNTFGEHTALSIGSHTIAYMAPQDIQDDQSVRVVLCKDAISTGWDCPRAEVLVSLRSQQDYTYIAQLIGRMVRTPLARRITTDQTLNDVHCYLPRFSAAQVTAIVERFAEGRNDEPPVEVITNPVIVERNPDVPDNVFELLQALPTYVVPGRIYRTQVARLHTLATLLSGDHIVEDALAQVRIVLNGVLVAQRARLESDGTFQKHLSRVRTVRVERTYALLGVESMEDLPDSEPSYEVERDDNNIEDLYKVALRKLPEGVASRYWNSLIEQQDPEDYDPTEAKAETAVLALQPDVIEAVEAAAEQLTRTWLREHQRSISRLPDAKKAQYEPVKRETRTPELTDLILPTSRNVPARPDLFWPKHVLCAEDGVFPADIKGWEVKVMERELRDDELIGWYRNPTGGNASLRVPYKATPHDRSMYPDLVLFHRDGETIKPSIVDPHGFHLADAAAKLQGLASYAAAHGDVFDRIDAVAEVDGNLLALDLKSPAVRDAVATVDDGGVKDLYVSMGGDYT